MRRYLIFLLALLLPLQSVLAITASYCAHERGETQHLGHHQHEHVDQALGEADEGPLGDHPDCAAHHMSIAAILSDVSDAAALEVGNTIEVFTLQRFSSPLTQRPERPKWPAAV